MKNLNKFGVQELGAQEMTEITGGSWLGDALRAVGDAIVDAADWVGDKAGQAWRWCKRQVKPGLINSGWTVPGDII